MPFYFEMSQNINSTTNLYIYKLVLEFSKVSKKLKYNSFRNKCLVFEIYIYMYIYIIYIYIYIYRYICIYIYVNQN